MRWMSLLILTLIMLCIAVPATHTTAFGQTKTASSLEDSLKKLEESLKGLEGILKGKKPEKPEAKPPVQTDTPTTQADAPKAGSKQSGQVYISSSEDDAGQAKGLSANDRVWTKAPGEKIAALSSAGQMKIFPPMDINKLSSAQYNGAVSAAMEGMRDLMGELNAAEEAKFSAKWAPLFGYPTEESVTYLNKLNPLLSELLSIRGTIATAAIEFDGAWEEAVLAASYDSEEGVREALGLAEVQKDYLVALQSRMATLANAVQQIGNPPDPIQAQQQARNRHREALKITETLATSAVISPASLRGKPNQAYSFTVKVSNPAGKITVNWAFGDGTVIKDSTTSANHTFKKEGNYTIRAVIYNANKSKIAEATAQAQIANESKAKAWVRTDIKEDKKLTSSAEGTFSWKTSDSSAECLHNYKDRLWSHYQLSWDIPPAQLKPGEKIALKINIKAVPGAAYAFSPTDSVNIGMSVSSSQYGQKGILQNAYASLSNWNVKNDGKTQRAEVLEFTVPEIINVAGEIKIALLIQSSASHHISINYLYKIGDSDSAPSAAAKTKEDTSTIQQPDKQAAAKALQETIETHKCNIAIIEKHLAKDREELAKETDPARRAALEFRVLQGLSDAQAEKDLIQSLQTGQHIHTRTAFDEYAHSQFIKNIRDNQMEMESYQKSVAALHRLAGMLPPGDAEDARDFIEKHLTLESKTKMDRETVSKIASALDNKVQGYFQGEAAKNEEAAALANLGLEASQNIKVAADTGMTICSVFGGRPINMVYQAATGYIEGGPAEAALRTASTFGTSAHTAVEAFKGYREGGWEGAATKGAKAFITAKAFEYGASKLMRGGQSGKPGQSKPTVKQQLEAAKFKQARLDGESLVKDFQRAQAQMAAAAKAGRSAKELTNMQAQLRDKAAAIHSSPHAKNFLKYKGDYHVQRVYNAHMKAVHAEVEAKFHTKMNQQGWNRQQLKEFRNASSAGSVGMDYDIGLDELAGNALAKNGQRATTYQWQTDAQKAWNEAYKETTKRSASMAWENVTTSAHAESYKDLAWLGSDKSKVQSVWAQQSADVTRYKAWKTMNDSSLSRMEALQEASRGTAKDIQTKLQPLLNNAKPASPTSAASLKQSRLHWQKVQSTLEAFGNNSIDPITAERRIREITGGKGIPEVVNDMGTLMEGLIRSTGTK